MLREEAWNIGYIDQHVAAPSGTGFKPIGSSDPGRPISHDFYTETHREFQNFIQNRITHPHGPPKTAANALFCIDPGQPLLYKAAPTHRDDSSGC